MNDDMIQNIGQEYSATLQVVGSLLGCQQDEAAEFVAALARKGYCIERMFDDPTTPGDTTDV